MRTNCTCRDYANPCKHLAAVFYILAEKFDDDPFLIFTWRGRSRDELLASLRERRGDDREPSEAAFRSGDDRPIGACLEEFWTAGESLETVRIRPELSKLPDAALHRLGDPPTGSSRFTRR